MDAKGLARAALAAFANGDTSTADDFIAPDYQNLESGDRSDARGPREFRDTIAWIHRAFAELRYEEVAMLADEAQVIAWAVLHGRQAGPFLGIASEGRRFSVEQVHLFRVGGGRLTGHRAVRDDLRLLLTLGARVLRPDGEPLAVHRR